MKPPYLIKSTVGADGLAWGVVKTDDGFRAEYYKTSNNEVVSWSEHSDFVAALRTMMKLAVANGLVVDWDTYRIRLGPRIVVAREAKGLPRETVSVFDTQQAYDEYRLALLAGEYVDDLDYEEGEIAAATTVAELLEAGNLEAAWEKATYDEDGSREAWRTNFGSFDVSRDDTTVAFSSLPLWIRQAALSAVAP